MGRGIEMLDDGTAEQEKGKNRRDSRFWRAGRENVVVRFEPKFVVLGRRWTGLPRLAGCAG